MKVLLINPSLIRAEIGHYQKAIEKQRGIYPSLGLGYIAAVLEKEGHEVRLIDCDTEEDFEKKIEETCKDFQPQLVGFYNMTWTFRRANALAKKIRFLSRDIKLITGGPGLTCLPKAVLQYGEFDFGVIGEGEKTIVELVKALRENEDFSKIPGLIYKKNGQIIENPSRPLIENLDSIPFPARHLMPMERYFDIFSREKKIATMIATRGCPFNCTFCDRKNRMGRTWRRRSHQNIIEEIKELKSRYEIREIMFFDDNFITDKDWALELCNRILKENLNVVWEIRTRADMIDRVIAQALREAGCYRVRIGFEAGDNQILRVLKKGIRVEQSLECARICQEAGIEIFGYFMMGSPYETKKTLEKTLNLALKINPDFAVFSKTILIPGSELFDWAVENNYIAKDYWEKFLLGEELNGAPPVSTKELPEEEVDKYISFANKKFYFRLKYILRRLSLIKSWPQFSSQIKIAKSLLLK